MTDFHPMIPHDLLPDFEENEHLPLPGIIDDVLSDHDLAAHLALGLMSSLYVPEYGALLVGD